MATTHFLCKRYTRQHLNEAVFTVADISLIVHLWDFLLRNIREWNDVNNVMDLERASHQKWDSFGRDSDAKFDYVTALGLPEVIPDNE